LKHSHTSSTPTTGTGTTGTGTGTTGSGTGTTGSGTGTSGTGTGTSGTGTGTTGGGTASADRKNLILESLFDGTSSITTLLSAVLSRWGNTQHCCDYSVNPSTEYSRSGNQSMRFELRKTDGDIAGSKRTEITQNTESSNNVERWYGVSYYFPAGYKADPNCPEIIFQWHHNSGTGSPPLALWSYGDKISFNQYNISSKNDVLTKLVDITPGQWMDFVFHIKFSPSSDGLVEIWANGNKVYSKTGINNYSGSVGNDYLKTGIYKWGWKNGYSSTTTERVIYIDDVRIGNENATYADVAPGGN
jgi:hypothetical protein